MLNGVVYPNLVREFWVGAEVFTKEKAKAELERAIAKNPEVNKNKSCEELGLKPYIGPEIRSTILGVPVSITRKHFAELLQIPNEGFFQVDTDKPPPLTKHRAEIKDTLYEDPTHMGRTSGLFKVAKLLHKILLSTIIPRVGGTDQISWDQRHLLLFLVKGTKLNLPAYLFHYLCTYIRNTTEKSKHWVAYPRLLSELFYQWRLVDKLREVGAEDTTIELRTPFLSAENLCNVHKISKDNLKYPQSPTKRRVTSLRDDVHPVYKNEPMDVIAHYIAARREEGVYLTLDDLQSEPEDDYVVKKRKRTTKKKNSEVAEAPEKKRVKKEKKVKTKKVSEATAKSERVPQCTEGPFVAHIDSDSDTEDDVPLSRTIRIRKPVQISTSGIPSTSVNTVLNAAQTVNPLSEQTHPPPQFTETIFEQPPPQTNPTQSPPHLSTHPTIDHPSVDESQPINMMLPGSSQIFPAFPIVDESPTVSELERAVNHVQESIISVASKRNETLHKLHSKIQQLHDLQQHETQQQQHQPQSLSPHSTDTLQHLEQHLHGDLVYTVSSPQQSPIHTASTSAPAIIAETIPDKPKSPQKSPIKDSESAPIAMDIDQSEPSNTQTSEVPAESQTEPPPPSSSKPLTSEPNTSEIPSSPPSPGTDSDLEEIRLHSETFPCFTMVLNTEPPQSFRPPRKVITIPDSDSDSEESFTSESSCEHLPRPPPPPVSNDMFVRVTNKIYRKAKALHDVRCSLMNPRAYIMAWDELREEVLTDFYHLVDGDLNEMLDYQIALKAWLDKLKEGYLKISEKAARHWQEDYLNTHFSLSMQSSISTALKFSLDPGDLFVSKSVMDVVGSSSELSVLKKELEAQKQKQAALNAKIDQLAAQQNEKFERIEAKQNEMANDLKTLITLLTPKP
jgi:hypothetical protein